MERGAFSRAMQAARQVLSPAVTKSADLFFPAWRGAWGSFFFGQPRTDYAYASDLGDGLTCSVIMPAVQWLMRAYCEAPLIVQQQVKTGWETVAGHGLSALLAHPNGAYGSTQLWMATIGDWCWFGESYWLVRYQRGGRPGELWWLPPWSIEPRWPADNSAYLTHYRYQPATGQSIDLDLNEVVHFRHGLDPRQHRHGLPPLRAVLRDVWADEEAGNWVASLLRNMGVPGLILSPKSGEMGMIGPEEMERIKAYVRSRFVGDQRGEPMALGAPLDVHRLAFSPHEMDMSVVRNTAEERVAAALGIPSAVIGFHSGLDSTKVGATMREMVQLAWSNGVMPIKRNMAETLGDTLLPAFEVNTDRFRVAWEYSEVKALQEDENAKATRYDVMVRGGWAKVSEARRAMGLETTPDDEIYLRPVGLTPTDPKDQMPEPEPIPAALALPAANGNGNGNGNGRTESRGLKQGSLDEWLTSLIGSRVTRLEHIPRSATRLAARLAKGQAGVEARMRPRLQAVFERYAQATATAAREVLQPLKATTENVVRTAVIRERLPLAQIRVELAAVYQELYDAMLTTLMQALRGADLPPLADPGRVRRYLQQRAQERPILLDLPGEARDAILSTLEQATAEGWSEDQMIEAIREAVPRGRWRSAQVRSEIIARNESRVALRLASSRYAREQGLRMLILDAQLGPTDETCEARNGWIVNPAQAEQLAASEHVGGTYQAIPIPHSLAQSAAGTA